MDELIKRLDKLEERQEAIINTIRWDRFPLKIRKELAEEKRMKMGEKCGLTPAQQKELKKETYNFNKEEEMAKCKEAASKGAFRNPRAIPSKRYSDEFIYVEEGGKEMELNDVERTENERNQDIFEEKDRLQKLYLNNQITKEEAQCQYLMIGTHHWYREKQRFENASEKEKEKIAKEKEKFEAINRRIQEKQREKEFDIRVRQIRMQELDRHQLFV